MKRLLIYALLFFSGLRISPAALFLGSGSWRVAFELENSTVPFLQGALASADDVQVAVNFEPGSIQFQSILAPTIAGTLTSSGDLLDPNTFESKSFTTTLTYTAVSSLPEPLTNIGGLVSGPSELRFDLGAFSPSINITGSVTVEGPTESVTEPFDFGVGGFGPDTTLSGSVLASSAYPDSIDLGYDLSYLGIADFGSALFPVIDDTIDGVPVQIALFRNVAVVSRGDGAFVAIPEPGQITLLLIGLVLAIRRRKL